MIQNKKKKISRGRRPAEEGGGNYTKECFLQEVTFALGEEVGVGVLWREVRPQWEHPFSTSKYDQMCLHSSHLPDPGNIAVS